MKRNLVRNILLLLLLAIAVQGCARYDYHPRGVHKNAKVISGKAKTYIVKHGDTLYSISKRYHMDYKALAKKNNLRRPYTIYVGQRLFVSGNAVASAKPTSKKVAPKKAAKTKPSKYKQYPTASHSKTKLIWPAKGRLSSKFGPRKTRMHDGLDIANVKGTRIVSAAAGTVVHANSKLSGYGNLIIIRHTSDMFTAYAHNQKNLVKLGDKVKQGQLIAYMGSTGRSTGSHVHFEVRRGETAVDPMAYLPKR